MLIFYISWIWNIYNFLLIQISHNLFKIRYFCVDIINFLNTLFLINDMPLFKQKTILDIFFEEFKCFWAYDADFFHYYVLLKIFPFWMYLLKLILEKVMNLSQLLCLSFFTNSKSNWVKYLWNLYKTAYQTKSFMLIFPCLSSFKEKKNWIEPLRH